MVFEGEGEPQKWTSGFERDSSVLNSPSDTAIKGVGLLLGGVVGVFRYSRTFMVLSVLLVPL